jgi:hypothetical protein
MKIVYSPAVQRIRRREQLRKLQTIAARAAFPLGCVVVLVVWLTLG